MFNKAGEGYFAVRRKARDYHAARSYLLGQKLLLTTRIQASVRKENNVKPEGVDKAGLERP